MKNVDLRLLQETSQGSLSKLREVAEGLKRKFPKVQIPSVLERTPEKDLFKATKIIENPMETAISDEYIDYTSRKILGEVKTSDYGGLNGISYIHRPSPSVEETLHCTISPDTGNSSVGVFKKTYAPDGKQLIEDRRFYADAGVERIETFDPVDGRRISREFTDHSNPPLYQNTKTVLREDGSVIHTSIGHLKGKELITTVEQSGKKSFPTIKQMRDGKLYASVQKNAENGDIIMELPINNANGRIKYTFSSQGIGKEVEMYYDNTLVAKQVYGPDSIDPIEGFNKTNKYI